MRGSWIAAAAMALSVGAAADAGAGGEAARGFAKSAQCVACHGAAGVAPNPTFPSLAGQNAGYLELQLRRFRSGERYDPLMTPVAESLADQDIDDLAVYYSAIGPLARAEDVGEEGTGDAD